MPIIKTPLLRYIAMFYGNIGIQLYPYSLTTGSGTLNFLQNLTISTIHIYFFLFGTPFSETIFDSFLSQSKPFFDIIFRCFIRTIIPLTTLIYMAYFLYAGPTFLPLLDSSTLRDPYTGKDRKYFSYFLLGQALMFFVVNPGNLKFLYDQHGRWNFLYELFVIFNLFILSTSRYFVLVVVHYVQYSTLKGLKAIKYQLASATPAIEERCISHFIALALVNRQVFDLLSIQLLLFYFLSAFNLLVVTFLAFLISHRQGYLMILFPIVNTFYLIYLLNQNRSILAHAQEIIEELKNRQFGAKVPHPLLRMRNRHNITATIRYNELHLYVDYFALKVFNLAHLNRPFLLSTVLVILNYTIFIYQTN